jgi:hypothetical protein
MNEPAEKRNNKIFNLVKDYPSGLFDQQISQMLEWDIQAVRAVCGILRKRGKLIVKEIEKDNKSQWFLLADDAVEEHKSSEEEFKRVTDRLGKAISDFLYVALRK